MKRGVNIISQNGRRAGIATAIYAEGCTNVSSGYNIYVRFVGSDSEICVGEVSTTDKAKELVSKFFDILEGKCASWCLDLRELN